MDKQEVTIVDVRVPFVSMVLLSLKFAVAAVPAILILYIALKYITFIFR